MSQNLIKYVDRLYLQDVNLFPQEHVIVIIRYGSKCSFQVIKMVMMVMPWMHSQSGNGFQNIRLIFPIVVRCNGSLVIVLYTN